VSGPPVLLLALVVEGGDPVLDWPRAVGTLAYLAVVNSFAGLVLLGVLVRRGGASAASAVFFLAPPVTALLAWLVLGETLSLREGVGLLVAVVGVAAATAGASGVPEEPAT
jgi:drug/metabolite transporter (DMT)-like permease